MEAMQFKRYFIARALPSFCSAEQNHLSNFSRGCYEEQFCEIILHLGKWFRRRCLLKDFSSGALAALMFVGAELFMQF